MSLWYIYMLLFSRALAQSQIDVCTDIWNGNAEKYSIEEINRCDQGYQRGRMSSPSLNLFCPELKCVKNCLFGLKKDANGCVTCDCASGYQGLYEGDIVLNSNTKNFLEQNIDQLNRGNTVGTFARLARGSGKNIQLWNQNKEGDVYIVPYNIESNMGSFGKEAIGAAISDFAKYTCIRLQPRIFQSTYLNFYSGSGCHSPVGRHVGRQRISIGLGCEYKGTVIHEILHSLGFWHEQSRPDRDQHIQIQWQHIKQGVEHNFNKLSQKQIDSLGSPYDVGSVMHYSSRAFSVDGQPTITDLKGEMLQTQRMGFSKSDIEQLNLLYGCKMAGISTEGTEKENQRNHHIKIEKREEESYLLQLLGGEYVSPEKK